MPATTLPKAAKPCPSGLRMPPKSSDGWSPMQMKKLWVAVSGPPRAIETVPSSCRIPVSEVRSSGMGGKDSISDVRIPPALDDRDADGVVGLVVRVHGPEEGAVVVEPVVDIAEEVGRSDGCPIDVDLQFERTHLRLDDDPGGVLRRGRVGAAAGGPEAERQKNRG